MNRLSSTTIKIIVLYGYIVFLFCSHAIGAVSPVGDNSAQFRTNALMTERDAAKSPKNPRPQTPNVKDSRKRVEKEMRDIASQSGISMNAKKTFEEIHKNFRVLSESKGVGFRCFVKGGLSRAEDHEIWLHQIYEEHKGSILGNLMYIPEMNVFRTSKKGALSESGNWVPLVSTPAGKRLDKVVHFPAELFRRAVREGIGTISWAPEPKDKEVELDHPDFAEPEELPEVGRTSVKNKEPEFLYNRMTVQLSQKTAVEFFNDVQKSGCLGGLG